RKVIDAWKLGGRSMRQPRKLAAVFLGQMPLGRTDLLVDQVEIVEQPFRGGSNATVGRDGRSQQIADLDQEAVVLGQAYQKLIANAAWRQPMRHRKALAVLLHLIGVEQIRSQRRLFVGGVATRPC